LFFHNFLFKGANLQLNSGERLKKEDSLFKSTNQGWFARITMQQNSNATKQKTIIRCSSTDDGS
jgi:hypothetical protein